MFQLPYPSYRTWCSVDKWACRLPDRGRTAETHSLLSRVEFPPDNRANDWSSISSDQNTNFNIWSLIFPTHLYVHVPLRLISGHPHTIVQIRVRNPEDIVGKDRSIDATVSGEFYGTYSLLDSFISAKYARGVKDDEKSLANNREWFLVSKSSKNT